MKKVHVVYYALLRQERGVAEETVDSQAESARELFHELKNRHGFKLSESHIKVAINSKMASWDTSFESGDTILFIPPVAGG
jgi:molybdopterin converting factor small subunit